MIRLPTRLHTRILLGVLVLSTPLVLNDCGEDKSAGNGNDTGGDDPFAETAEALNNATVKFLESNAEISASFQAMEPHIAAVLGFTAATAGKSVRGVGSCLPEGVNGKRFHFDGTSYIGTPNAAVQEYAARFVLYELALDGTPVLSQSIGYVDLNCAEFPLGRVSEIQITSGGVIVASTTYLQTQREINGTFQTPDGEEQLFFTGRLSPEGILPLNFLLSDELHAGSRFPFRESGTPIVREMIGGPLAEQSQLYIELEADANDDVQDGFALYGADSGQQLAACITSGELPAPVFSIPSPECYDDSISSMSVTSAQLQSMFSSYQSTRAFWLAGSGLVEICLDILAVTGP